MPQPYTAEVLAAAGRRKAPAKPAQRKRPSRMLNTGKKFNETTKKNAAESPLLRFAPEIRNRIWKLALGGKSVHVWITPDTAHLNSSDRKIIVTICRAGFDDAHVASLIRLGQGGTFVARCFSRHEHCIGSMGNGEYERAVWCTLSLLRICKQIHSEAALLPFQTNTFAFADRHCISIFIRKLMPSQQRAVASLTLYSGGYFYGLTGVKAFAGLRSLTIFHTVDSETDVDLKREGLVLRQNFLAFKESPLTSVQVCIFRAPDSMFGVTGISHTDPDILNVLSEEIESKLLESAEKST